MLAEHQNGDRNSGGACEPDALAAHRVRQESAQHDGGAEHRSEAADETADLAFIDLQPVDQRELQPADQRIRQTHDGQTGGEEDLEVGGDGKSICSSVVVRARSGGGNDSGPGAFIQRRICTEVGPGRTAHLVGLLERGKAIHDDEQAHLLGWRRIFANEESLVVGSHTIEHIVTLTRRTQVSPRADLRNA